MRVPTALHLCQHLILTVFFILTILVVRYVIMDLIFISLMAIDIELFVFVSSFYFLWFIPFAYYWIVYFLFSYYYFLLRVLYIIVSKSSFSDIWFENLFSKFVGCLSNFLNISHRGKILSFDKDIYQSFMLYSCDVLRNLCLTLGQRFFTRIFFL